jgi:predicted  nucleic acid-binding Zn-ribbon protein
MPLALRQLWKLHEVDLAILEIRKQAAALDPGKKIQAEIAKLDEVKKRVNDKLHALQAEEKESALKRQSAKDKISRLEKQLYGGGISPREVETIQKEIENLNNQIEELEYRELEISEQIEPLKAEAGKFDEPIMAKKQELAEYQKKVLARKNTLETQFKELTSKRGPLAKEVNPSLLARYEAIRQKQGGIGMVQSVKGKCSECGVILPVKLIEAAREDRVVTCESCHRLLYVTDGLV